MTNRKTTRNVQVTSLRIFLLSTTMNITINRVSAIRAAALLSLAWRNSSGPFRTSRPIACAIYEKAASTISGFALDSTIDEAVDSEPMCNMPRGTIVGLGDTETIKVKAQR